MFKFEVPSLTVGTLDTLMTLSDDLVKTDQIVEQTVRKIEKTTAELFDRKTSDLSVGGMFAFLFLFGPRASECSWNHHISLDSRLTFRLFFWLHQLAGVPAQRYIQQFAWDSAKYPNRRPLKELVALIAGGAAGIEEELKQLTASYMDKTAALADAKRKSGGNLMVIDLNDALDEETMRQIKICDTEYLKTVFIAIPKGAKENFESTVESLASECVGYGGPDWSADPSKLGKPDHFGSQVDRQKKLGSPVVPGSIQKVKADDESILYAVTILKGQYEPGYYEGDTFHPGTMKEFGSDFATACREKRFVLREFEWDASQASKSAMAREQLQVEVDGMKSALMRWCKTHYGDAFVAWMHIKAIRVFVESVLRYGLPVDFTSVLYKVNLSKETQLTVALDKYLGSGAQEDLGDDDGDEYHDFVLIKFDP